MKFKRLLCFLLLLPMILVSVLAVANPGSGNVITSKASGSGNSLAHYYHTGLALGIQIMDDPKYTVKEKTKENTGTEYTKGIEFIDGAEINNKGLANVCNHFMYSYPNPYNEDVFYLLPNTTYEPDWRATTVGGVGQTPILGRYARQEYLHSDYEGGRTFADEIYQAITKGKADETYFKSLINKVSYNTALSYIGYIFGSLTKTSDGYDTPNVSEINKRWQAEYIQGVEKDMSKEEQTKRKIANYTAILTCLAKLMSADKDDILASNNSKSVTGHKDYKGNAIEVTQVWDSDNATNYAQYIATFATNALNGKAYQPIVITAEVCLVFRHENEKLQYDTWRTSTEHIALLANVAESQIRDADSGVLKVKSLGENDVNVAQTILKTAIKKGGGGGGTYGGYGGSSVRIMRKKEKSELVTEFGFS